MAHCFTGCNLCRNADRWSAVSQVADLPGFLSFIAPCRPTVGDTAGRRPALRSARFQRAGSGSILAPRRSVNGLGVRLQSSGIPSDNSRVVRVLHRAGFELNSTGLVRAGAMIG